MNNITLPEKEIYSEELDFTVSAALSPLKSFFDMILQNDDGTEQIEILDDLFQHAEKKLQDKVDAIYDQVGVVRLHCAGYNNSQHIPCGTLMRVEFDKR